MRRPPKERVRPYDTSEPKAVGDLISDLFALRGYGKVQSRRQLDQAWQDVAGEEFANLTSVMTLKNGVLQIAVTNSALLSELASFHKQGLLDELSSRHGQLKIRDIKFKLRGRTN